MWIISKNHRKLKKNNKLTSKLQERFRSDKR